MANGAINIVPLGVFRYATAIRCGAHTFSIERAFRGHSAKNVGFFAGVPERFVTHEEEQCYRAMHLIPLPALRRVLASLQNLSGVFRFYSEKRPLSRLACLATERIGTLLKQQGESSA